MNRPAPWSGPDLALLGLGLAGWLLALLYGLEWAPAPGALDLPLYPFYALAAGLGFGCGLRFAWRRRELPRPLLPKLLLIWLLVPPGLLFGLRSMAPLAVQEAVPLAPMWSFGVFAVLFLVPVAMLHRRSTRRD